MIQNHPPRLRYLAAKLRLKSAENAKFFAAQRYGNLSQINLPVLRLEFLTDFTDFFSGDADD